MSSKGVNKVVFEELSARFTDLWNLVENGDNCFRVTFLNLRKPDPTPRFFVYFPPKLGIFHPFFQNCGFFYPFFQIVDFFNMKFSSPVALVKSLKYSYFFPKKWANGNL